MVDHPGTLQEVLSANLRRLRIARRLSLSELARATTMSKATLSGIENGRANPTVETLAALAAALGVSVVELLDEPAPGEVRVVRATVAGSVDGEGVERRLLETLGPGSGTEVSEVAVAARQAHELRPRAAGARAGVYVLAGTLIAGPVERSTELAAGDYMAFPADVPHLLEAGRRAARALLLTQLPA
jgi:transcriptional regulator with XRE-family HTH domain